MDISQLVENAELEIAHECLLVLRNNDVLNVGSSGFTCRSGHFEEVKSLLIAREGQGQTSDEEEDELKLRSIRIGNIPRYIAQVNRSHLEMVRLAEQTTQEVIQQLSGPTMVQVVTPTSAVA